MTQARAAAAIAADLNSDRVVSYLGDFRAQLGSATRDAEIADFDDLYYGAPALAFVLAASTNAGGRSTQSST